MKKKCIVWGGYGFGNTGDELCLEIAIRDARMRFGDDFAVLTPNLQVTQWLFPDVKAIAYEPVLPTRAVRLLDFARTLAQSKGKARSLPLPRPRLADQLTVLKSRPSPPAWLEAISSCEELMLAGGGYLNDITTSFYRSFLPLQVASALNKTIRTASLGLGPFLKAGNAHRVASCLRQATMVNVRDQDSLAWCREQNIDANLVCDEVFTLKENPPEWLEFKRVSETNVPPRIGVCFFGQNGASLQPDQQQRWLADFLKHLKQHFPNHKIEGFCFYHAQYRDFNTMVPIFQQAGLRADQIVPGDLDYRINVKRLARYDLIISMRFHAVVLAKLMGIPTIALRTGDYYASKMGAAVSEEDRLYKVLNMNAIPPDQAAVCAQRLFQESINEVLPGNQGADSESESKLRKISY